MTRLESVREGQVLQYRDLVNASSPGDVIWAAFRCQWFTSGNLSKRIKRYFLTGRFAKVIMEEATLITIDEVRNLAYRARYIHLAWKCGGSRGLATG